MIRFRLELREHAPTWLSVTLPLIAIVATLVICAGLVALAGANVFTAYAHLFMSAVSTRFNIVETLVKAAPIMFTGLAVAVAFRAKFWNIGAEGQLLAGAIAAGFIGGLKGLPAWSLVPLMLIGGMITGGLWALLPAVLKTRYKVDDVVTTLLLNFIMLYIMGALLHGPWRDPISGFPDSPDIRFDAEFPILLTRTRLHLGVVLAFVAAPVVWFLMRRTTLGFDIRAVGENANAARYAGINIPLVITATAVISGALAGLAGAGEVGGVHFQVLEGVSPGYGYTGIVIAMLAQLNPLGVIPASIFFAIIITGAEAMSRATGVPVFLADVFQGVALICMIVALLFRQYRVRLRTLAS